MTTEFRIGIDWTRKGLFCWDVCHWSIVAVGSAFVLQGPGI